MWAHYATNAAGFAVEFLWTIEQNLRVMLQAFYANPRSIRARNRRGHASEPKSHESLSFSKYMDWS